MIYSKTIQYVNKHTFIVRQQLVMIDQHLAELLDLQTKAFNQMIKRQSDRFPDLAMFQLTSAEWDALRLQIETSKKGRGGRRFLPYAFTKTGLEALHYIAKKPTQKKRLDQLLLDFTILLEAKENEPKNKLSTYTSTDGAVTFDIEFNNETVWLTQQQMAQLFDSSIPNISMHIQHIYEENELQKETTIQNFLIVQSEGDRCIRRSVVHYNLDVVISVGYRVKSTRGIHFRQWAANVIKQHIIDGFTLKERANQDHLEQAQVKIDNRIGIFGDVHVYLKDKAVNIELPNATAAAGLEQLIDRLIETVKDERPELESYLNDMKKNNHWGTILDQLKEGSFLRSVLDSVSDAKDIIYEIINIVNP